MKMHHALLSRNHNSLFQQTQSYEQIMNKTLSAVLSKFKAAGPISVRAGRDVDGTVGLRE